jgi:hypothetical protein
MDRAANLLSQLTAAIQERLNDPKNAMKGDWIGYHPLYCLWLLTCEIRELIWELWLMEWFAINGQTVRVSEHKYRALSEAGDVCVCIIMILNVWGVIKDEDSSKN